MAVVLMDTSAASLFLPLITHDRDFVQAKVPGLEIVTFLDA